MKGNRRHKFVKEEDKEIEKTELVSININRFVIKKFGKKSCTCSNEMRKTKYCGECGILVENYEHRNETLNTNFTVKKFPVLITETGVAEGLYNVKQLIDKLNSIQDNKDQITAIEEVVCESYKEYCNKEILEGEAVFESPLNMKIKTID